MWRKEPAVMVMVKASREPMVVLEKEEVKEEEQKEEEETGAELVIPCDDHTWCNDKNTCCPDKNLNKWFCCPLPKVNIHNNSNTTTATSDFQQLSVVAQKNPINLTRAQCESAH